MLRTIVVTLFILFTLTACAARQDATAKAAAPTADQDAYGAFGGEYARGTVARARTPPAALASVGFEVESRMVADASVTTGRVASPATPASPLAHDRLLTKEGGLWLRVPHVDRAQQEAVLIIESEGGLIYKSQIGSLEARVPPERFEDTMDRLAAIGIVAQRWTNIEDVTEQVADLDLRLGVAREGHGRLSDLLAKADKVEDMLAIERELRRLTEEIERIEGQRRGITRRIESSIIKLTIEQLAEVANQPRDTQSFPWITNTGIEATRAPAPNMPLTDTGWLARALIGRPFDLGNAQSNRVPDGLVPIHTTANTLIATTPEDHRLRARVFQTRQEATIDFWSAALRRSLENVRGYEIISSGAANVDDNNITGTRLETRVRFEGEIWRYNVWVLAKENSPRIAVIEAAWREAESNTLETTATQAVRGLRLR